MKPTELLTALQRTVAQLEASNEIAKALTSTLELREVLALVMQKVSELLHPRNWSLLLQDERTGELYFEVAVGEGAAALQGLRLAPGEGIAGAVFASGAARRVDDVSGDSAFAPRFDAATSFRTRSVLAVPLVARGHVLGLIELVNGADDPRFDDDDLQALTAIADYAAIALMNARAHARVQELTITDEHTGVYNSRHLRALLEQEVTRARRFVHPLSLIFLDLDRFKGVNDAWGHLMGSALLKEAGELLCTLARPGDTVFRYGGDEFALLLVETGAPDALAVGQRVCEALRAHRFLVPHGLAVQQTASVGVATYPDHCAGAEALLHAADTAMYVAKAGGRDRAVLAGAAGAGLGEPG